MKTTILIRNAAVRGRSSLDVRVGQEMSAAAG